jgi:hypothetical protein
MFNLKRGGPPDLQIKVYISILSEICVQLLYFTVPHLSLRTPCGLHKSVRSLYGVRMESARTARTMLVKKKKARSPCGLRADLLKFTIKKLLY